MFVLVNMFGPFSSLFRRYSLSWWDSRLWDGIWTKNIYFKSFPSSKKFWGRSPLCARKAKCFQGTKWDLKRLLFVAHRALDWGRSPGGRDLLTNKYICKADTNFSEKESLCFVPEPASYTRLTGPETKTSTTLKSQHSNVGGINEGSN